MNDSSTSTSKIGSSIKESVPLVKVRKCKIYALRHALCAWRIVEAGPIRGFGKIPAQKLQLPELIVRDFSFAKIPQPADVLDVQSLLMHFWLNSCFLPTSFSVFPNGFKTTPQSASRDILTGLSSPRMVK